jgi:predicted PurR-regulated permease PerM
MEGMRTDGGGSVRDVARGLAARLRAARGSAPALPANGPAGEPEDDGQPDDQASRPDSQHVPNLLRFSAAWAWRLLLVAAVVYLVFKIAVALRLLVIPLIIAILLTALLQPLTALLRRAGLPALAATWCTVLAMLAFLFGVGTLITNRVQADYPRLAAEVRRTVHELQAYLAGPPFRLSNTRLDQLFRTMLNYVAAHKSLVAGTVLTGGKYFLEVLTALILTVFITFFLLKDGNKIWSFLISGLRPTARRRAHRAGEAGWQALVSYIRGTTVVAAIHALIIGLALWLLGVPLLVPLVILVFIAAYIPLIGILVVGALAILVTLATTGYVAALILLAVFLAENQLESHMLQPLVVGRIVRLHPLAVIVVLAVGGIVAGIPGAIVAVPAAAVVTYAWPYLRADPEPGRLAQARAGSAGPSQEEDS